MVSATDCCVRTFADPDRIPKPQRTWEEEDASPAPATSAPAQPYAPPPQGYYGEHADYNEAGNASGVTVSVHAEEEE